MISQILTTTSRFSAMQAGIAAAFVCALGATDGNARVPGADALGFELEHMLERITKRHASEEMTLAQYADDCDCGDVEDLDDEYDGDFAEDFEEDVDEYDDEFAEDRGGEYHASQGPAQSAQELSNRMLDRQIQVMEKTILWRNPMGPGMF